MVAFVFDVECSAQRKMVMEMKDMTYLEVVLKAQEAQIPQVRQSSNLISLLTIGQCSHSDNSRIWTGGHRPVSRQ